MKILFINSVCGIGSTGRICTDLADILTANENICKIAYARGDVPDKYQKYAVRIGSSFDIKIHALKARIFDASGFGSKQATEQFIDWVKEYDPDVIHLHNIHGYYMNIDVLFAYLRTCNKKIIWTLHDCWSFTGHCAYFDFIGCDKWKGGCQACPQKTVYPKSLLADASKSNYIKKKKLFTGIPNLVIVTPSKWLAELVNQSYLKEYPVEVIHNGIDLSVFMPIKSNFHQKYNIADKKIILGVANTWDARKGLEDFIKLSKMLDNSYQIVLVGLTNKQLRNLPENVIGIRKTNGTKELAEIYSAADVFLNPTYEDNYPTVNLEAQACGTPVITYRTGGSVESVLACNIVEKGNIVQLKDVIMGEEFGVADGNFDKQDMLSRYLELYKI